MLPSSHDIQKIVPFVMIMLVGGMYGTSIQMIRNNVPIYGKLMLFEPKRKN